MERKALHRRWTSGVMWDDHSEAIDVRFLGQSFQLKGEDHRTVLKSNGGKEEFKTTEWVIEMIKRGPLTDVLCELSKFPIEIMLEMWSYLPPSSFVLHVEECHEITGASRNIKYITIAVRHWKKAPIDCVNGPDIVDDNTGWILPGTIDLHRGIYDLCKGTTGGADGLVEVRDTHGRVEMYWRSASCGTPQCADDHVRCFAGVEMRRTLPTLCNNTKTAARLFLQRLAIALDPESRHTPAETVAQHILSENHDFAKHFTRLFNS
jgi:hypothetical protein